MIELASEADTLALGSRIAAALRAGDVVALAGDLGAGKTTLARGILRGLGFAGDVPSPTFTIVQSYEPPQVRLPLWHCDLYRLDDPDDLRELGLDDVLGDGALIVEWPERAGGDHWPEALVLLVEVLDGGLRRLTARVPGAWEGRWPC